MCRDQKRASRRGLGRRARRGETTSDGAQNRQRASQRQGQRERERGSACERERRCNKSWLTKQQERQATRWQSRSSRIIADCAIRFSCCEFDSNISQALPYSHSTLVIVLKVSFVLSMQSINRSCDATQKPSAFTFLNVPNAAIE